MKLMILLATVILCGCAVGSDPAIQPSPPAPLEETVDRYPGGATLIRPKGGGTCFCRHEREEDGTLKVSGCSFLSEPATDTQCRAYSEKTYSSSDYTTKNPAVEAPY